MRKLWRLAGELFISIIKRFFANKPRNQYERIVFGALRDTAMYFGKGALA